jgi:hypothetical protein
MAKPLGDRPMTNAERQARCFSLVLFQHLSFAVVFAFEFCFAGSLPPVAHRAACSVTLIADKDAGTVAFWLNYRSLTNAFVHLIHLSRRTFILEAMSVMLVDRSPVAAGPCWSS